MYVQTGQPRRAASPVSATSLSAAVSSAFAPRTEQLVLFWRGAPVRVAYGPPLAALLSQLLPLLGALLSIPSGSRDVIVDDASLAFSWNLSWANGTLSADSRWTRVPGDLEAVLNERSSLTLSVEDFLAEWKQPLRIVLDALSSLPRSHAELARLAHLEQSLPRGGYLYERT